MRSFVPCVGLIVLVGCLTLIIAPEPLDELHRRTVSSNHELPVIVIDPGHGGNDDGAKQTVTRFAKDFGWPVTDLGGIEVARVLEPLCILWVLYGTRTGGWDHALKMLRK